MYMCTYKHMYMARYGPYSDKRRSVYTYAHVEREGERERERERKRKRKSAKKVQRDEGRDTYECYENVHLSLSPYSIAPACTCDR